MLDQILRTFLLALVTITAIFVLFMVMAEASRQGLTPSDMLRVIPYIVPSSLPYTMPVALLFAVSVVYGRMASDNEIVAIKSAGLSALSVLTPTWVLGMLLTGGLAYASADAIPRSTGAFRKMLLQDVEDLLYKTLKKEGKFDNADAPFFISVNDVVDRTLIGATFKHRKSKEDPNTYDLHVSAEKARIKFDVPAGVVRIELEKSEILGPTAQFLFWIDGKQFLEYPLPKEQKFKLERRIQEKTNAELSEEQAVLRKKLDQEQARQAVAATMWIASGRINKVKWPAVGESYKEYPYWKKKIDEYETEKNLRIALAAGTILFVWIGGPVGILFARRDFLTAFGTCFLPIIGMYYPLVLLGVNLAKEGTMPHEIVFAGDAVLAVVGLVVVWRVWRH